MYQVLREDSKKCSKFRSTLFLKALGDYSTNEKSRDPVILEYILKYSRSLQNKMSLWLIWQSSFFCW